MSGKPAKVAASQSAAAAETAELIFQAIHYDNAELLSELLEAEGADTVQRIQTSEGRTPLHYAAANGALECTRVLCDRQRGDVDSVAGLADSLRTPLLMAADGGHERIVGALINAGADLFYCDANGYSALQLAQLRNHPRVADLIFESIESIRRQSDQLRVELRAACRSQNYSALIDALSRSTANTRRDILCAEPSTSAEGDERPALCIAAASGNAEMVAALLGVREHTLVDPRTGRTALHEAVASNSAETVKLILAAFAELMDTVDERSQLPFHLAAEGGNAEIVKILLTHNYPPGARALYDRSVNGPAYEFACDLNAVDGRCRTALHCAVESGNVATVRLLLRTRVPLYGTDGEPQRTDDDQPKMGTPFLLDTYASNGRTPLMTAVCAQRHEIVEALLDCGADVNLPIAITDVEIASLHADEARCVGSGALIEAAIASDVDLLRLLFFHSAVDYDNQALRKASKSANATLMTIFLEQLTFADHENRINSERRETPLSAIDRLKSLDLLPGVRPTVACRLDWHNAGLSALRAEFLSAAAARLNPRIRTLRQALTAITRIDLSDNELAELPEEIFQMASLRILNVDHNRLVELRMPKSEQFGCPFLESLSADGNRIEELPDVLFDPRPFPQLKTVNIAANCLRRLPPSLWRHPRLQELNAAHNQITELNARGDDRSRQRGGGGRSAGRSARAVAFARRDAERYDRNGQLAAPTRRRASVAVEKADVQRSNIWQNEVNVAHTAVEEEESPLADAKQPAAATSALRTLNLSANRLRTVPDCLACVAPRLLRLDLSHNELGNLRALECFPATLKHLNLAHNRLIGMFRRADAAALHCYAQAIPVAADQPHQPSAAASVNRHSRSRSKSVARNQQRSLSIIRASKETENLELCAHKLHCRFDHLKHLNLSHNQLSALELFIPVESRLDALLAADGSDGGQQLRSHLIFPQLTNLDLSHNHLHSLPTALSLLSQLAVLNLSANTALQTVPVELGVLEKLWSVSLAGCALREPLKSIVAAENFKTIDFISFLRSELDNSKSYTKLKLFIVGRAEVGKSSLLAQIRNEGHVPKAALATDATWSARLGHSPLKSSKSNSSSSAATNRRLGEQRRAALDVAEWVYEPPRHSKNQKSPVGPITFRTWDFDRLQKEFEPITQYFMSRRAICLVVWKVTDGEIAIQEIHEWLLAIQARAPNATVLIVGTHLDCVEENRQRFPDDYLSNLETLIQQRFVNVADADKKGLPRVAASLFVSIRSKQNISALCELLYVAAQQVRTVTGRRQKLVEEKIPASYIRLEKIIAKLTDEYRQRNDEPVVPVEVLFARCNNEYMAAQSGASSASLASTTSADSGDLSATRLFRDPLQFRAACGFLHENGCLLLYDDAQLRDLCFIDPQWLYTVLRSALSPPPAVLSQRSSGSLASAVLITQQQQSGSPIIQSGELVQQLKMALAERRIKFSAKHSKLRRALLPLLSKFETALPCLPRTLLIPPLLPDEYLLRADYPGARIRIRAKIDQFRLRAPPAMSQSMSEAPMSSSRYSSRSAEHSRLSRTHRLPSNPPTAREAAATSGEQRKTLDIQPTELEVECVQTNAFRRLYSMQYVPVGFWPRLTTRILNDEKLCSTIAELFVQSSEEPAAGFSMHGAQPPTAASARSHGPALVDFVDAANLMNIAAAGDWSRVAVAADSGGGLLCPQPEGGFEFLLWRSGLELRAFGRSLLSLKQFLPLASVADANYAVAQLHRRGDDLQWRRWESPDASFVELLIPCLDVAIRTKDRHPAMELRLRSDTQRAAKLLASVVGIVDDLLEDWFPALGTRFVHSSDGQLLVDRLIPCGDCSAEQLKAEAEWRRERKPSDPSRRLPLYLFSVEECILDLHDAQPHNPLTVCPSHGRRDVHSMAPDLVFGDLTADLVFESASIRRGQLLGRGAFGRVYAGYARSPNETFEDVALKVLEPGGDPKSPSPVAIDAADRLETVARSYCVARQELNLLGDLQHSNITVLLGFARSPLTLLMELAPHGALDQILAKYRRSEIRLAWDAIQQSCAQVARALEYLHSNHIIYRDLKAENVLVWRFPVPNVRSAANAVVHLKLGDYGISRFSYPSEVCKGYGGTEGFMAPEILRYNGEYEYTEKVDCYSFGMFVYELISLRHPYDGQEQMKDCIFEGRRPLLSEKDILCPSNVLDLMVCCWAESASNRPSASELVSITAAPEFTNLADVAILADGELPTVAAVVAAAGADRLRQLWLSRADGTVTVLAATQHGFLDAEHIGPLKSRHVTAVAEVAPVIWCGDADGTITIFSGEFAELAAFGVESLAPSLGSARSRAIRQIVAAPQRSAILLATPEHFLLCVGAPTGILPHCVAVVQSDEPIHVAALLHSAADWQLWTAHDDSRLVMHHLAGSSAKLLYSASATHPPAPGAPITGEGKRVKFLIASVVEYGNAWSSLENDGRVFMWENGICRRQLDCSKILPVSESLSSMFDEDASNEAATAIRSRVTALAVHRPTSVLERLIVGTTHGVIIILECKNLSPLTSFRTYGSAVEAVLCSAPLDTGDGKTDDAPQMVSSEAFFITVGRKYRNLVKRLSPNVLDKTEPIHEDSLYVVVWQGDNWT